MTTDPNKVPGEKMDMTTTMLGMGSSMLQSFRPIKQLNEHLCGICVYDKEPNRQVITHHFVSHVNEEVRQALIYDSNESTARLIGVEYVISERLYYSLPEDEKRLWHSHVYQVKSGIVVEPGVPEMMERKCMSKLVSSYGKSWFFWQVDKNQQFPLGPAMLMRTLSSDQQVNAHVLAEKDRITGINTAERKHARAEIPFPIISPAVDRGF